VTTSNAGPPARKFLNRILATSALLGVYLANTIAMTGVVTTSSVSPAMARGKPRGGGVPHAGVPRASVPHRGGHGRGGGGRGIGFGVGVVAGIISGAIAADAARHRAAAEAAVADCTRRFRSYNPNTGTYIAAGGVERPCP